MKKNFKYLFLLILIFNIFVLTCCQRPERETIKGTIVAILGPCIGSEMIVSVSNDINIGSNNDILGRDCFMMGEDTVFEYKNVIAVPLYIDSDGNPRYIYNGRPLKSMRVGDYIEFEYRCLSQEDSSLFINTQPCLEIFGPPSNIQRFVISRIIKFRHRHQ